MNTLTITLAISVLEVLKWYAAICLISLPFSILALVLMAKRNPNPGKAIKMMANELSEDRKKRKGMAESELGTPVLTEGEFTDASRTKNLPSKAEEEKAEQNESEDGKSQEDIDRQAGITPLRLYVGDRYRCRLTARNIEEIHEEGNWDVTDPFAAEIDGYGGTLTAKRVARFYVTHGGALVYHVEVLPRKDTWFGEEALDEILSGVPMFHIKMKTATQKSGREMIDEDRTQGLLRYRVPGGEWVVTGGSDGAEERMLFILDEDPTETVTDRLTEYMEGIAVKYIRKEEVPTTKYWFHIGGDESEHPGGVDYVAILKKAASGKWYFGVALCWREGAGVEEVSNNTRMTDRLFAGLMDETDIPRQLEPRPKNDPRPPKEENSEVEETEKEGDSGEIDPSDIEGLTDMSGIDEVDTD